MNQFETTITSIRNILRVEGITGLDSINHCVALLVSRYLTIEKCSEFEIPLEFAFENFLKNEDGTKCDDQTAIAKFYTQNGDEDCLFVYLQDKLNFNTFKFKINAPLNFLKIYEKLEDINISNLFDKIDIVGAIYELHLKTGTTGSGMRDLGQYFTNREVIKYMIKLCDPKLKKNGDIESILDPSMGTGGFLSMSIKHLNKKHKNINWKLNKDRIYGFDVDETVKNMSLLNALLECGQIFNETFVKNDTLHNDYLIDKKIIDKVDIILANEPFGLKNIIHANCCKRIKDLKIEGTKAEPLFLQLMMQSLNVGGRCAVIIPDGVLFNDAKLYKLTRKYLCDNLRLAKVISLEDGLFLNTGVKSSILFFVNDGETKEVEFCKIKISSGEIVEELIIKVNIEEIKDNDYSLFVNKYNKVNEEKLNGIEYKKLGEILKDIPTTKTISSNDRKNGLYRFFSCSKDESTHNTFDYNGSYLVHGSRGSTIDESIFFTQNEKFSICTSVFLSEIINPNLYNLKYIYYYFKNNTEKINKLITTTAIPMISKTTYYNIEIPIPPLSSQEQIVEALDLIYDTIEGNSKLIQNYEKIKKGIIWSSTFNIDKKKIEDIATIKGGKRLDTTEKYSDEKTDFYYIQVTEFENINDKNYKNISESIYKRLINYKLESNNILISIAGTIGRIALYKSNKNSILTENAVKLIDVKINNNYLYNILKSQEIQDKFQNSYKQATIPKLSLDTIRNITIPIPSNEIQEYIVTECEYYDNLIDTLKKENERLQNNKIIETVLKSVSNDNQLEESKEKESDEELTKVVEKDKPTKESKSKLKN
jgi:type I restriction-modification system DNA methylase subunit/restriction endonuclease S subunit